MRKQVRSLILILALLLAPYAEAQQGARGSSFFSDRVSEPLLNLGPLNPRKLMGNKHRELKAVSLNNKPDSEKEVQRVLEDLKRKGVNERVKDLMVDEIKKGPARVSSSARILKPEEDIEVRVTDNSPSSAAYRGILRCRQSKDDDCAVGYAKQLVRYYVNLNFEIREITKLIGRAMIEEEVVDPQEWIHIEGMVDYAYSAMRYKTKDPYMLTHKNTLERVKADPEGEVEIYYFFTVDSGPARGMAPDVERLWRLTQNDPRVKMVVLSMEGLNTNVLQPYKQFTGLSMPIYDGSELRSELGIAFPPALVVVAPNSDSYYVRNGKQSFEEMYEFVKKAQGLPATITTEVKTLLTTPVGKGEESLKEAGEFPRKKHLNLKVAAAKPTKSLPVIRQREELSKF